MIFGQDRRELREMYTQAWRKARAGHVLSALESQIAAVVEDHPEYQGVVEKGDRGEGYTPEGGQTNPWLHMGLHLAIREQLATNRPPGVRQAFAAVAARARDRLDAEHRAMDCLAETLWEAQRLNAMPDEQAYLERLRRLT